MSDPVFITEALTAGVFVGFVLSLIGGGGSVLATPLLLYFVHVGSPHAAIGTGAVAVAANALSSLAAHARAGAVKWRCGGIFAVAGIVGAFAGSSLGKAIDGTLLIGFFGGAMILVGVAMLRRRTGGENADVRFDAASARRLAPRLGGFGLATGGASGFFGIGGGFLIAPALMAATNMPMRNAVATSLVAVSAFGLTTALNYAEAGYVVWPAAAWMIAGGVAGAVAGQALGARLSAYRRGLVYVFSAVVIAMGLYIIWRSVSG